MKPGLVFVFLFFISGLGFAQPGTYRFHQLYQLDSIGKTSGISQHFGDLYYRFLLLVEQQLVGADTTTQRLVRNFEMVFADFYIEACSSYSCQKDAGLPAWRSYFYDSTLSPIQYKLLGANAHLNGGLAEAIAHSYTPEEWKLVKKQYVIFNYCLNTTYGWIYKEAKQSSRRVRILHRLSLGLDRPIGNLYLYKWRKRQMRLTGLYYASSPRYEKLLKKVNRKKERIDRMVIRQIY